MNTTSIQQTVDEIIAMYHQYGHEQYGEKVTQLQHMVQTASFQKKKGMMLRLFWLLFCMI